MAYDFDRVIDRAGTNATKLQKYAGTDILPFWIADMDFAVPDFILEPLLIRAIWILALPCDDSVLKMLLLKGPRL